MTAPPDLFPDRLLVFPTTDAFLVTQDGPETILRKRYVRHDGPTMQAAIAAARTEGREQGLREAALITNQLLRRASFGTGRTTEVTYCDFVGAAILALIPAPPPADGGDTPASVFAELVQRQEPLAAEFEQIIEANREGLYAP